MALTDLLKGAGRVVQAAALGLVVQGCGGADKPKEPTYEGMCEDYRTVLLSDNSCGGIDDCAINGENCVDKFYRDCLTECEPKVNDWRKCTSRYCKVKVGGGCGIPNQYRKQEIDACGEEFSVEQLARCAC